MEFFFKGFGKKYKGLLFSLVLVGLMCTVAMIICKAVAWS